MEVATGRFYLAKAAATAAALRAVAPVVGQGATSATNSVLPPRAWTGFYTSFTPEARSNAVERAVAYGAYALGKNRPLARQLLRETAMVESDMGMNPHVGAGGPFQITRTALQATQDVKSHPKLLKKFKTIRARTGIDWPSVTYEEMRNPDKAAIAARLLYSNNPGPIPSDARGRAWLWKSFYNSFHQKAKGTIPAYLLKARRLAPVRR